MRSPVETTSVKPARPSVETMSAKPARPSVETMSRLRILFLSDTHLGFDYSFRPRVQRRRRGDDFFANFERALRPALEGKVDLVLHGGDLLYRSQVPAKLVELAFAPLKKVADAGVPVYLVPGNHERSRIPYPILAAHPRIHVFDEARVVRLNVKGFSIALVGFPYVRDSIRDKLSSIINMLSPKTHKEDLKLLLIHHCVEGARVGPNDYTFRSAPDVIRAADLPGCFDAILSGHIHRFQILTHDLAGRPLPAPVFYPGSIERTSTAEIEESKGYLMLEFYRGEEGEMRRRWSFEELPARPMFLEELEVGSSGSQSEVDSSGAPLATRLEKLFGELPADAVLHIRARGTPSTADMQLLSAPRLRSLAPKSMNVNVSFPEMRKAR